MGGIYSDAGESRAVAGSALHETKEPLCRYMRMRHFIALSAGTQEAREQVEAEGSNAIQIGGLLMGKHGGVSWWTTPSFAAGRTAESIAPDWKGAKQNLLYMNMGHGDKVFASHAQNKLFENGILWLLGKN